jgi:hypothetical protein
VNSRELAIAAIRGGAVERKPVLSFDSVGDILIHQDLSAERNHERIDLFLVSNPFGLAKQNGTDLNQLLEEDIESGSEKLSNYAESVRNLIQNALDCGFDGVFYVLQGARGSESTPMQYGGHYLELDRQILSEFSESVLNCVFVVGHDDVYIDFVSDLPAHLFAWDADASTFDSKYVRTLRSGAQASSDPESEVFLSSKSQNLTELFMKEFSVA